MPLKETAALEFCAFLAMEIEPFAEPAVAGLKVASNATDWPAEMVAGTVRPLTLKAEPLTWSCDMLIELCPEFCSVTACVLLPCTKTLPYVTLLVLKESCGAAPDPPLSFTLPCPPCRVTAVSVPETVAVVEL